MHILIADDHPLTLAGTRAYIESLGYFVAHTCQNGIVALNILCSHKVDIALLDINMPGLTGLQVLQEVKAKKLSTKIILLTMHKEHSIFKLAKEYGAVGYLLKEHAQDELPTCLSEVKQNRIYISPTISDHLLIDDTPSTDNNILSKLSIAELRVTQLIASQYKSKEIASMLFISEKTVEVHRRNIMEKLGLPKEKNALLIWASKNAHLIKK